MEGPPKCLILAVCKGSDALRMAFGIEKRNSRLAMFRTWPNRCESNWSRMVLDSNNGRDGGGTKVVPSKKCYDSY